MVRLQELPMESVYEITRRGTFYVLVFFKKPDAKLEKGIRGFRAIALMSALAKWYSAVVVGLLHEEAEPFEWTKLPVGSGRGINCERMQRS